jgi:hypothetical protein
MAVVSANTPPPRPAKPGLFSRFEVTVVCSSQRAVAMLFFAANELP